MSKKAFFVELLSIFTNYCTAVQHYLWDMAMLLLGKINWEVIGTNTLSMRS
jgi:hypothetical protein